MKTAVTAAPATPVLAGCGSANLQAKTLTRTPQNARAPGPLPERELAAELCAGEGWNEQGGDE